MRKRILFIVNPISGGQIKTHFPSVLDQFLDHELYDAQLVFTEGIGHASLLALEAIAQDIDIIASVGGDGTINEIASVVESSGKSMAIIPCGSGNGLARTLKIPLNNINAIKRLNHCKEVKIDCGVFNEKKFFNMAGIGFDAHISALFSKNKNRGFKGYINTTFKEINAYKAQQYEIEIDEVKYVREAFMLSIANSSQYGNNAHISPLALLDDGLLDVCVIKPFPMFKFPLLGYRMFSKTANKSSYVEIFRGEKIKIVRLEAGPIHLDGEPFIFPKEIDVSIKKRTLSLLI